MSAVQNPTISLVTPSFNQADFLSQTLNSIHAQRYPALQHVVMDAASTDASPAIIRQYADHLHFWSSAPDDGQYAAINAGFAHTSGEIMAWLNSDDLYFPWTLQLVAEIFEAFPQVEWLTSADRIQLDQRGLVVNNSRAEGYAASAFMLGRNAGVAHWSAGYIQQESTFWRRTLWERAGGYLDAKSKLAGDFDLWLRFFKAGAHLYAVTTPLAGFRRHATQKTGLALTRYAAEAQDYLRRAGGCLPGAARMALQPHVRRIPGAAQSLGWKAWWIDFDFHTMGWTIRSSHFA